MGNCCSSSRTAEDLPKPTSTDAGAHPGDDDQKEVALAVFTAKMNDKSSVGGSLSHKIEAAVVSTGEAEKFGAHGSLPHAKEEAVVGPTGDAKAAGAPGSLRTSKDVASSAQNVVADRYEVIPAQWWS